MDVQEQDFNVLFDLRLCIRSEDLVRSSPDMQPVYNGNTFSQLMGVQ